MVELLIVLMGPSRSGAKGWNDKEENKSQRTNRFFLLLFFFFCYVLNGTNQENLCWLCFCSPNVSFPFELGHEMNHHGIGCFRKLRCWCEFCWTCAALTLTLIHSRLILFSCCHLEEHLYDEIRLGKSVIFLLSVCACGCLSLGCVSNHVYPCSH